MQVDSTSSWSMFEGRVTVDGHSRIEELKVNADSTQAFVAMWFDDSMNEAFKQGMELAVSQAGYRPMRIDRKEHINKIDDEIVAEIRRSRFLVADFTQGADGARGGVYYEAGFRPWLRPSGYLHMSGRCCGSITLRHQSLQPYRLGNT